MLAPLVLRGSPRRTSRLLLEATAASFLGIMGLMALIAAGFVYIFKSFGLDIAFLALAGVLLIPSALMFLKLKWKTRVKNAPVETPLEDCGTEDFLSQKTSDPLAQKIPDALAENPTFKALVEQINGHPVPATAGAFTLGMILANEVFAD